MDFSSYIYSIINQLKFKVMKKLTFIFGVVVTNIVLVLTAIQFFNHDNLPLTELEYFNGFDIYNLFPSDIIGNVKLFGSIIGLVLINVLLLRVVKRDSIFLK